MSEVIYKDYLPANARILVDYRAKEKVKFSYPIEWTYWKAVRKRALPIVMSFIALIFLHFAIYISIVVIPYFLIYLYLNPITYYVQSHWVTYDFSYILSFVGFIAGIELLIILCIPSIITIYLALNKERLGKWIPLLGYWNTKLRGRIKEKIFTSEDIIENKVIIPIFSNIFLRYECTGDFDKFLDKIEILEIPFSYKKFGMFLPFLRKIKREKNDLEFRAVFYFSQKPVNGNMEVLFD